MLDSRTPGPEQIGTVWLPLPHLLMLPFVDARRLVAQRAGGRHSIGVCFVLAGAFLFARRAGAYSLSAAALAVALLFALNPNMLYLQSTPMTEPLFAGVARGAAVGHAVVPRFAIAAGRCWSPRPRRMPRRSRATKAGS